MYDCHIHTVHSFDGSNEMDEYTAQSIKNGIKGICFTDHIELEIFHHGKVIDLGFNNEAHIADFEAAKDKYGDKIEMARGIEVGMQKQLYAQNKEIVASYKPDFVLGSIHAIDTIDVFHATTEDFTRDEVYLRHLEATLEMVKTHDYFDCLGHLDLILRMQNFAPQYFNKTEHFLLVDDILKAVIATGKGIEVNTAGWRYGLYRCQPSFDIIKRYKDLGGHIITLGSDSHNPTRINDHVWEGLMAIKEAGFKEISYFTNRQENKRTI